MTLRQLVLCVRKPTQGLLVVLPLLLLACGGTTTTPALPGAPTGLSATGQTARIDLAWTAAVGATSYLVRRSTTAGGPYDDRGTASGTSTSDTGLPAASTFFYVVRAVNAAGQGADSNEASATTSPAAQPPAAPTGLTATGLDGHIDLAWSASTGATSYLVRRGTTAGGPYADKGTPSGTTFSDTGLAAGATFFYVVRAVSAAGQSGDSNEASATTTIPVLPPDVPAGLSATPGNAQISLAWTASVRATSYEVFRGTAPGGPYTSIATPADLGFTDTGLTDGTLYTYVVRALGPGGPSANSSEVSATTAPAVPTGLTAQGGVGQITLGWTASAAATGYEVSRGSAVGGPFTLLASPSATAFVDSGLAAGATFYYVVRATLAGLQSGDSGAAGATTAPPAPTGVVATRGNGAVGLNWTAAPGATSYGIRTSATTGGPYVDAGSTAATSFTVSGLANEVKVFLVVRAVNAAGTADSAEVSATPTGVPDPPTNLGAAPGDAQVTLSWTEVATATGYRVHRSTTQGTAASTGFIAQVAHSPFVDTGTGGPVNGTTYYYALEAYSANGISLPTAEVSAMPQYTLVPPTAIEAVPRSNAVYLHWTQAPSATGARVLRRIGTGAFTSLGTTSTADYLDSTTANGTTYGYVLHSLRNAEETGDSAEVTARPARELCMGSTELGSVLAVDADATGDTDVRRTFGTASRMGRSPAVAVAPAADEVLVVNSMAHSVTAYPRTASVEAPPLRVLAGEASGFGSGTAFDGAPIAIAYSSATDEIFVAHVLGAITVHDRTAKAGDPPKRTLRTVADPMALATDATRLWVTNTSHVYAFPLAAKDMDPPAQDITCATKIGAGSGVASLAVGPSRVYVADDLRVNSIALTANGELPPAEIGTVPWTAAGTDTLYSIAYDSTADRLLLQGVVYVAPLRNLRVASLPGAFVTGDAQTLVLTSHRVSVSQQDAMALDTAHDELVLSGLDLLTYQLSGNDPARLLIRILYGLSRTAFMPGGLSVDRTHGELYSCTRGTQHSCDVHPLATQLFSTTPLRKLWTGANTFLADFAVDEARGELYVDSYSGGTYDTVSVFDRLATGSSATPATPLRVLNSSTLPTSYFFDAPADELWMAQGDASAPAVHVYKRGSTGTLTLTRTLAGAQTGLVLPMAVWADATDVAVLDDSCTLRVYPRALGNVAPTFTVPPSDPAAAACVGLTGDATSWYVATNFSAGAARVDVFRRTDGALVRTLKPLGGGGAFRSLSFCSD